VILEIRKRHRSDLLVVKPSNASPVSDSENLHFDPVPKLRLVAHADGIVCGSLHVQMCMRLEHVGYVESLIRGDLSRQLSFCLLLELLALFLHGM